MTKRARGTVRPGQRRPIQRRVAGSAGPAAPETGAATVRPAGLTEAEARRAAELEAQLLVAEREAESTRTRGRMPRIEREAAPSGSLAIRAQQEYAYVARDVKDIIRISLVLFAILFGLWILIDVAVVFS